MLLHLCRCFRSPSHFGYANLSKLSQQRDWVLPGRGQSRVFHTLIPKEAPFLWSQRQSKIQTSRKVLEETTHLQQDRWEVPHVVQNEYGNRGKSIPKALLPRPKLPTNLTTSSWRSEQSKWLLAPADFHSPIAVGNSTPLPAEPSNSGMGLLPSSCSLLAPALASPAKAGTQETKMTDFHSYITSNIALKLPTTMSEKVDGQPCTRTAAEMSPAMCTQTLSQQINSSRCCSRVIWRITFQQQKWEHCGKQPQIAMLKVQAPEHSGSTSLAPELLCQQRQCSCALEHPTSETASRDSLEQTSPAVLSPTSGSRVGTGWSSTRFWRSAFPFAEHPTSLAEMGR